MRRLALLVGWLSLVPLMAAAQDYNRAGGKMITLPPSSPAVASPVSDTPPEAAAASLTPVPAPGSAATPVPPDERSAVAVALPPPLTAVAFQPAPNLSSRINDNLPILLLAACVLFLAIALLAVIVALVATTRRRLRAYVFVSGAEIVDLDKGSVPVVKLDIKNSGQTPAYKLSHIWRCGTYAHPLDEKLPLPQKGEPMAWAQLGAGATVNLLRNADTWPVSVGNGAAGALTNHPVAFYVYGEILYRDAFRQRHFTRYVFYQPGHPRLGRGPMLVHERGNDAN